MKQVRFYLLLILLLSVISCGNEEGDPGDYYHPYIHIEGTFPDSTTIKRELILVYNGDTLENKKVKFVSRGSRKKPQAVLTFENVINGEAKTEIIADLTETVNPDNGIIRLEFEGVYSTKSRSVTYSGYIEPLVLLLNLKE